MILTPTNTKVHKMISVRTPPPHPEFQSNPVAATKIPCGAGVLDLCLLWKDQVDVCTYANKEIEVCDMKETKVIELNATGQMLAWYLPI